ncbi:MAG: hypothetical protein MPJ50_02805 [Pirellulales bacterium]|nr:hypothetical protein [Pirellulales bacterium]
MALVCDGMPCAICREPIADIANADIFATTYCAIDDPQFAPLDDSAMHQRCIDTWPLRDAYVEYYNAHCRRELRVNRRGNVVYRVDWIERFMDIPAFSYVGHFVVFPIFGLISWFGESAIGIALSVFLPLGITLAVAPAVTHFSGLISLGLLSAMLVWSAFGLLGWLAAGGSTIQPRQTIETKPCQKCGQPLRTSLANQCFQCGADWH